MCRLAEILFVIAIGYCLHSPSSIPGRGRDFSLLCSVQTGFGARPASYPKGTGGSFLVGKAAGV
jgi:hypothetical protein